MSTSDSDPKQEVLPGNTPAEDGALATQPANGAAGIPETRRASMRSNNVVLSTSPFPTIAEMDWLKQNCPEFLASWQQDLMAESKHRRRMEERGHNSGRYVFTLLTAVMLYAIYAGNAWAAATLAGAAAVLYAASALWLGRRSGGSMPNFNIEGRDLQADAEVTTAQQPAKPPKTMN